MDEEHERYECKNEQCRERDICEEDLVWVKSVDEYPAGLEEAETLDAADLLKGGKVMPFLREWVAVRVGAAPTPADDDATAEPDYADLFGVRWMP